MKKHILKIVLANLIIWAVLYGLTCFAHWKALNPIQWIIDLPKYSFDDRLLVLFLGFGWIFVNICVYLEMIGTLDKIIEKSR